MPVLSLRSTASEPPTRQARSTASGGEPGNGLPDAFRYLVKGYYCCSERCAAEIWVKMADTVGDCLLKRLRVLGLRRVLGYWGGSNGIVAATNRTDPAIGVTQFRHEEQAAFMACAHLKDTGDLGAFLAASRPGAIHPLNGLYDTTMDHRPAAPILPGAGSGFEFEHQEAERYAV